MYDLQPEHQLTDSRFVSYLFQRPTLELSHVVAKLKPPHMRHALAAEKAIDRVDSELLETCVSRRHSSLCNHAFWQTACEGIEEPSARRSDRRCGSVRAGSVAIQ